MIKLNVVTQGNQRLLVFGMTERNMTLLLEDKPIAFPADQVMVHSVRVIYMVAVKTVGHFLSVVGPALGLTEDLRQIFIDTYRIKVRDGKAGGWIPWMRGSGHIPGILDDGEGTVACGFLTRELLANLRTGEPVSTDGTLFGLREWDKVLLVYRPTHNELRTMLVSELLPSYDVASDVLQMVDTTLQELG